MEKKLNMASFQRNFYRKSENRVRTETSFEGWIMILGKKRKLRRMLMKSTF